MARDWPIDDERELLADACTPGRGKHALWNFCRFAAGWDARALAREQAGNGAYWLTDAHRDFIDWLGLQIEEWRYMRRTNRQERFQILAWLFRGFGKTNLVTTCVPLYVMLTDPDLSCYIGSETHDKSKEFYRAMQPLLDGTDPHALFAWLFGVWYHPDRSWTTDSLVTAYRKSPAIKEPSLGTFGVDRGITGKHPGVVIYDDPISEEKLKEGGLWMTAAIRSMDSIYPALTNDSLFILIGTRYRQDDVIGTVLENEGTATWVGHAPPHAIPEKGQWRVYFLQGRDILDTKEYPKGRPVLPVTWSDRALTAYETRNTQDYETQIMGRPMTGAHIELSRERIQQMFMDRTDLPPIEYATIHLDTAFKLPTRRARGDRNAIVTWLHDIRPTGIVYFDSAQISATWTSEQFDQRLIWKIADLRSRGIRVRCITDENEMGGKRGVYLRHLQDVITQAGLRLPEIMQLNRGGRDDSLAKIVRIREAAGYWMEGLVKLVRDAEGLPVLMQEMSEMGFSRYDDVADAAADVFRPEIWRGRGYSRDDEQPFMPVQPGDDVLKGRMEEDLRNIEVELRTGRRPDRDGEDPQPEPEVHEAFRPW